MLSNWIREKINFKNLINKACFSLDGPEFFFSLELFDNDEKPTYGPKKYMNWGSTIVYGIKRFDWFSKIIKVDDNLRGIKCANNLKEFTLPVLHDMYGINYLLQHDNASSAL